MSSLISNKKDEVIINLGKKKIKNSEYEKLLGIKVDTKLNFNDYLSAITSKSSCKVNALPKDALLRCLLLAAAEMFKKCMMSPSIFCELYCRCDIS